MKLEKRKFQAVPGLPAYQLVDQFNIIVGVVACVTEEATEKNAILFQYAEDMKILLEKCAYSFKLLKVIDKTLLAERFFNEINTLLKEMEYGT